MKISTPIFSPVCSEISWLISLSLQHSRHYTRDHDPTYHTEGKARSKMYNVGKWKPSSGARLSTAHEITKKYKKILQKVRSSPQHSVHDQIPFPAPCRHFCRFWSNKLTVVTLWALNQDSYTSVLSITCLSILRRHTPPTGTSAWRLLASFQSWPIQPTTKNRGYVSKSIFK